MRGVFFYPRATLQAWGYDDQSRQCLGMLKLKQARVGEE